MSEFYNPRRYTYDLIPKYRHEYIEIKIKSFIEIYGLHDSDWPMDCPKLIRKMKDTQYIPFFYGFFNLSEHYDAITAYMQEYDVYLMQINRKKVNYPFYNSYDRRLNFTLAHEIGHIILEHLLIPKELLSNSEKKLQELEADEFAGKFLMPEELILNCNFYSRSAISSYLNVSNTALWYRLNNLKRLDLLLRPKTIPTCSTCGNTQFSVLSEFCGICGQSLYLKDGLKGIRRVNYPIEIPMDKNKKSIQCPNCKRILSATVGEYCAVCKTTLYNFCSSYNPDPIKSICDYANPTNSRFCEVCGEPTYYYSRGILKSWDETNNTKS